MNFKQVQQYFTFNNQHRAGIFLLFGIIIVLQLVYYFIDFSPIQEQESDKQQWLTLQTEVDSLKLLKSNDFSEQLFF